MWAKNTVIFLEGFLWSEEKMLSY
ncbi:unnamed protein product [Gulo gulo]|uniref:Uncharacterized protein n=1 Tax=Gulo gulo TaxID=48420 RepID=A0A9X9M467_GULGU|nr:unnamed protein product [Gulo gulo]